MKIIECLSTNNVSITIKKINSWTSKFAISYIIHDHKNNVDITLQMSTDTLLQMKSTIDNFVKQWID
jgi:hypothetical protein